MVNLCFSDSTAGTLRYAFRSRGEETVCLPLLLFWGDVSGVFDSSRRHDVYEMFQPGYAEKVSDFIKNFNRVIKRDRYIRIWYSSGDADELCGFLHAVSFLNDDTLSAVDCNRTIQKGDCISNYRHSGDLDEETLIEFLQYEFTPDQTELRGLWEKLAAENTPLRVIEDGALVSAGIDYYDNVIRRHLSTTETSIARIIGEVISYENIYSDTFIAERLRSLVEKGQLLIVTEKADFYRSTARLAE